LLSLGSRSGTVYAAAIMRASASSSRPRFHGLARVAFPALALCGGLLSACNVIFGISEGQETAGTAGTGGASSSTTGTSGTGGSGGLATTGSSMSTASAMSTTTTSSGSTSSTGTGGAAPVCDGTGPKGSTVSTATFAKQSAGGGTELANAVAIGADGSVYTIGSYDTGDVYFTGAPLPYDTLDGASDGANVFVLKRHPDGSPDWAVGFKGKLDQNPLGIALDDSGHVFVTGRMEGSMTIESTTLTATGLDVFVFQLDAATGALGWARSFGGPGDELGQQVAVDGKGHVFIAGVTNGAIEFGCAKPIDDVPSGIFLVALDASLGTCVWEHKYLADTRFADKDTVGYPVALAVDRSGSGAVYLAGGAASPNFGQGPIVGLGAKDVFVFKASSAGDYVKAMIFGAQYPNDGNQYASSVAVDPCGNVVLTGSFTQDLTFGLLPTLHTVVHANDAGVQDIDEDDMFLAKLDSSLKPIWSKSFGDSGQQLGISVAVDAFSNITVGAELDDRSYSTGVDFGGGALHNVGPDSNGYYNSEIAVARFDAAGNYVWAHRYGTAAGQRLRGVAIDDTGHTAFVGHFLNENGIQLDFGGGTTPLLAQYIDAFFVRLGP
jgi:hypothetical protein